MIQHLTTVDGFYPRANALRSNFEDKFRDPRSVKSERFVWDYWHLPEQYTFLRTPASEYFPKQLVQNFFDHLTAWGSSHLGCRSITPPWLSYYIDGCSQEFHSDVPHGPWAYVFSLSPRRIKFRGGETVLVRPQVLQFWEEYERFSAREQSSYLQKVSPRFNRLVVFDPRIPHGVTRVEGVRDPLEARLVVHGWFSDPAPFFEGALPSLYLEEKLDKILRDLQNDLNAFGAIHGFLSFRIHVKATGDIEKLVILANNLVSLDRFTNAKILVKLLEKRLSSIEFRKAKSGTKITIPFLFQ